MADNARMNQTERNSLIKVVKSRFEVMRRHAEADMRNVKLEVD